MHHGSSEPLRLPTVFSGTPPDPSQKLSPNSPVTLVLFDLCSPVPFCFFLRSDLVYAVKRLIRGLASSRDGARQGFSTALAELMRCVPAVTPAEIIKLVEKYINVTNSAKSQEQKDGYFGQAFGLFAVIRSGRIAEDESIVGTIVAKIVKLARTRSFLSEVCCEAIVDLVGTVSAAALEEHVVPKIGQPDKSLDQMDITLALAVEGKGGELGTLEGLPATPVAASGNYGVLTDILSDIAGTTPLLPCWWRLLIAQTVAQGAAKAGALQQFWSTMVDAALFSEQRATHGRKALGFAIFREMLPGLQGDQATVLFSHNFMRSFITNLSSPKNYLHKAASETLRTINEYTSTEDDVKLLAIVAQLTGPHGSMRFDALTKTKTIELILSRLTLPGIHGYIDDLFELFLTARVDGADASDAKQVATRREIAVDQIVSLIRNHRVPKDEDWTMKCVKFLFVHGHCSVSEATGDLAALVKGLSVPVAPATQKLCAERCFTAIFALSSAKPYEPAAAAAAETTNAEGAEATAARARGGQDGTDVDGVPRIARIADFVTGLMDADEVDFVNPLDTDTASLYAEMRKVVVKIRAQQTKVKSSKKKSAATAVSAAQAQAFEVLLLHLSLGLFKGVDSTDTVDVIRDLLRACSEIFGLDAKSKKKRAEDEPDPIEILVEILLSFLANGSASFRGIASHVFEHVSGSLTLSALSLLFEILGQEELDAVTEGGDASDGEDAEDDEGENAGGKRPTPMSKANKKRRIEAEKAFVDTSAGSTELGESDDSEADEAELGDVDESDADSDNSDGDDDDAEVDPALREALAGALGTAAEGENDSDNDSALSDWDDDRMLQIDDAIAAQFQLSKNSQVKNKRQQQQATIHFKLRVLDLLEVYVRKQSSNPLVLELITPVLEAIVLAARTKGAEPLQQRLVGLLKNKLCTIKSYPTAPALDVERAEEILTATFAMATQAAQNKEAELASLAVLLLVRILVAAKTKSSAVIIKRLYTEAFEDFMTRKKSRVRAAMIKQLCTRFSDMAADLIPIFANGIATGLNEFRKGQAIDILHSLIKVRSQHLAPETCPTPPTTHPQPPQPQLPITTIPLPRHTALPAFQTMPVLNCQ